VQSELGKGTTMAVTLPALDVTVQAEKPIKQKMEEGRNGRILVMDDEEPILDVVAIMLEKFGYTTECVRSGEEALAAYRMAMSSDRPFDGVIMDLTIRGGLGGKPSEGYLPRTRMFEQLFPAAIRTTP
jgi:two-component system, cell cycle sensor histidine kinase and response regulator CckA